MEGFVKQIHRGGWEAERLWWGWRNREKVRGAVKKARQLILWGRETRGRGHREPRVRNNVGRKRMRSAGDREKSILCKPAMQPLALQYSVHLHKGKGSRGGVSVGDGPLLEVWQRAEWSESCGQIRTTRSPSQHCTSLTCFPNPYNVFPGPGLVFLLLCHHLSPPSPAYLPPPSLCPSVLHHADSFLSIARVPPCSPTTLQLHHHHPRIHRHTWELNLSDLTSTNRLPSPFSVRSDLIFCRVKFIFCFHY